MQPLAWEPPYITGVAVKKKKKKMSMMRATQQAWEATVQMET